MICYIKMQWFAKTRGRSEPWETHEFAMGPQQNVAKLQSFRGKLTVRTLQICQEKLCHAGFIGNHQDLHYKRNPEDRAQQTAERFTTEGSNFRFSCLRVVQSGFGFIIVVQGQISLGVRLAPSVATSPKRFTGMAFRNGSSSPFESTAREDIKHHFGHLSLHPLAFGHGNRYIDPKLLALLFLFRT